MELAKAGFPMEKIVIRIDPIIPTEKGLSVAYPDTISQITGIDKKVIESYKYGYRKPSFGNYLILLELSKTV